MGSVLTGRAPVAAEARLRRFIQLALLTLVALPAAATPRPLLGPAGPVWLGTITPGTQPQISRGRSLVMVDPESGALRLEQVDLALTGSTPPLELRRIWDDDGWRTSLDDRLVQTHDGVEIRLLEGVLEALPETPVGDRVALGPLGEGPIDWPIGSVLLGSELRVEKLDDGWHVTRGTLRERYDADGWLLEREGRGGAVLRHERKDGLLTRVEAGDGRGFDVLSDDQGRPAVFRAPEGLEIDYDFQDQRLRAVSSTDGGRTRFSYDDRGLISAVLWPDGVIVRVRRDDAGRVQLLAGPGPLQQRFRWSANGVVVTDATGGGLRVSRRERDDGLTETVTDGAGRKVRALLTEAGATAWTDPKGATWLLRRDEAGRITTLTGPGGRTWRFQWDGTWLVGLTDPAGGAWRYQRDGMGNTVAVTDPVGRVVTYPRDPSGRVVAVGRGGTEVRLRRDYQGRVTAITTPGGGRTDLERDALGRLVGVKDPGGHELTLSDYRGTAVGAITNRESSTWSIERDVMGRPTRIEAPSGDALAMRRGSLGRVDFIGALFGDGTEYGYRPDGRMTWIRDALGATTGLIYAPSGLLRAVRRPDLTELVLSRDPSGEIVSVRAGDTALAVQRSAAGLPLSAGPLRWAWDLRGQLTEVRTEPEAIATAPDATTEPDRTTNLGIALARDSSGAVRQLRLGDEEIELTRDTAGRVIEAHSETRAVALSRDAGGAITGLRLDENPPLTLERDTRGLVTVLTQALRSWRILRDGEGRALKWTAPDGTTLSSPRDAEGRPELVRYPDGTLARVTWDPTEDLWQFEDSAGQALDIRRVEKDLVGRAVRVESPSGTTLIRRDALGRPVSMESEAGTWSWTREIIAYSGDDGLVSLDARGLPSEARPPMGQQAWGVALESLSYLRDALGRVSRLLGDRIDAAVGYDPAGRLETLDLGGARWRVEWDLLGRPSAIQDPDGKWRVLEYGPEGLLSWRDESQGLVDVVHDQGWGWLLSGDLPRLIVTDERGVARETGYEHYEPVRWTPMGFPDRPWDGPVGWRGTLSLFSGGPLLDAAGAWDPVSGTWLDRPPLMPWAPAELPDGAMPAADGTATPWWDPEVFAPESPWSDPLGLLVAMGELQPAVAGEWLTIWPAPAALPWLPQAAATPSPPLCPPRGALPLDAGDTPLAALAIRAALPPSSPVDTDAVIEALLTDEFTDLAPLRYAGAEPSLRRPWWPPVSLLR